jgi:hypothetical protein
MPTVKIITEVRLEAEEADIAYKALIGEADPEKARKLAEEISSQTLLAIDAAHSYAQEQQRSLWRKTQGQKTKTEPTPVVSSYGEPEPRF